MARRNRGPRVVWLPGTNANSVGAGTTSNHIQTFIVGLAGAVTIGDTAVGEIPLVVDNQVDATNPATSLADIESSGYRLRRIVGKIWVRPLTTTLDSANAVIVTAGLIVRRTDVTTGGSFAALTGDATLINPQDINNDGDPWIWRRSWLLDWTTAGGAFPISGSGTNYGGGYAGGNADAAHVDQKTARIVSSEERLFLDVSLLGIFSSTPAIDVQVWSDLRVLGSMRSSSGNRNNASR